MIIKFPNSLQIQFFGPFGFSRRGLHWKLDAETFQPRRLLFEAASAVRGSLFELGYRDCLCRVETLYCYIAISRRLHDNQDLCGVSIIAYLYIARTFTCKTLFRVW